MYRSFTESSGKEKQQHWTNFKIILNFIVYEGETDPLLSLNQGMLEVSGATALISGVFSLNYPLCPSPCSGKIYIHIYAYTLLRSSFLVLVSI